MSAYTQAHEANASSQRSQSVAQGSGVGAADIATGWSTCARQMAAEQSERVDFAQARGHLRPTVLRRCKLGATLFAYAFDLIELNGDDLRGDPLEVRKATLASIVTKARPGIHRFSSSVRTAILPDAGC